MRRENIICLLVGGVLGFSFAYSFGLPTFLEKCRSDIQLSKNAGRIADALERK